MALIRLTIGLFTAVLLMGQNSGPDSWADTFENHYALKADITYATANNIRLKLDVWQRQDAKRPVPTAIYIHGGGWVLGDKAGAIPNLIPYLRRGWDVVNVEYRLAEESPAPAAVEDTRCALGWVFRHAKDYHFDLSRLILTGHSAGGHLALITGMLPAEAGFDEEWPSDSDLAKTLHVAAIVNWYGITDVRDLITGPNRTDYALSWFAGVPNAKELAWKVSPIHYVGRDTPPIISIHGSNDHVVPYSQAVRFNAALQQAGVVHQLVTVPDKGHGDFNDSQTSEAYRQVWKFLDANVPGLSR